MGVNHRSPDILVPHQFLHRADIVSFLQQVCRKAMPECVTTAMLDELGLAHCLFNCRLHRTICHVVSSLFAASRVD